MGAPAVVPDEDSRDREPDASIARRMGRHRDAEPAPSGDHPPCGGQQSARSDRSSEEALDVISDFFGSGGPSGQDER